MGKHSKHTRSCNSDHIINHNYYCYYCSLETAVIIINNNNSLLIQQLIVAIDNYCGIITNTDNKILIFK